MTILKKAILSAVGAIASYYAVKYVTQLLEEKPLKARVRDAKSTVVGLKDSAEAKLHDAKDSVSNSVKSLSAKVDSLIQDKLDKTE